MVRVVFFTKRNLWSAAAVLLLLMLILAGFKVWDIAMERTASVLEPIYRGNTDTKAMAFAINVDWGEDILPQILELFEKENIQVTFFVTGRFAGKYPDLVKQMDSRGHEIGNHGYSHNHPDRSGFGTNQEEITRTHEELKILVKEPVLLYAPPYGECSKPVVEAAEKLGFKTIMWTIDTVDWKGGSPQSIAQKVINKAENGAIVLMHPKEVTLKALPIMIQELKSQGYELQKISQIIQGDKSQNN